MLNYNKLRYFTVVAEEKNITRAAQALYMAQPTLSVHMKELEQEIGVPLFERGVNRLSLTEAGMLLYERVKDFYAQEERMLREVRQSAHKSSSSIRVGTIGSNITYRLQEVVQKFCSDYPSVTVDILRLNVDPLTSALKSGKIDVGFNLRTEYHLRHMEDDFLTYPVDRGRMVVLANRMEPFADEAQISLTRLRDSAFVAMDPKESNYPYHNLVHLCREAGFEPNIVETYAYIEPMLTRINMSRAVTITSDLAPLKGYENIRCLPLEDGDSFAIDMFWRMENRNPAVQLFVNEFMKQKDGF